MERFLTAFAVTAGAIILLLLIASLLIFFKIFYAARKKSRGKQEFPLPEGAPYEPHHAQMIEWIKQIRAMDRKDASITSFDGLTLRGKYYEHKKGAPIEIMFHGYRGTAERDLCGGVHRCFEIGHNALIVDQRGAGESDGHVITFGARESRDCRSWIDFVIKSIDPNARIILTGISMGAATVMLATGEPLPKNVIGVLADCGYTSTRDIIKKVIRDMHLPAAPIYPLVRLGARLFGGFDPDKDAPIKAMERCTLPVIFFHGDADDFVPCSMSEKNFAACRSEKKHLVIIPGAGHGLCFPVDPEGYLKELAAFFP
ncbi:MAG: alpha/beta hydrolase [Clostridia bacterium]|nr:alpha/beta hydrolase [Clostridia bacterium]